MKQTLQLVINQLRIWAEINELTSKEWNELRAEMLDIANGIEMQLQALAPESKSDLVELSIEDRISNITLDLQFEDYAREESGDSLVNAQFVAEAIQDLSEVEAEILDMEMSPYHAEVKFKINIRQAFRLDYNDIDIYDKIVEVLELYKADRFAKQEDLELELKDAIEARIEELFKQHSEECRKQNISIVIPSRS